MNGGIDDLKEMYRLARMRLIRKGEEAQNIKKYLAKQEAEYFLNYKLWKLLVKAANNAESYIIINHKENGWFNKMPLDVMMELKTLLENECGFVCTYLPAEFPTFYRKRVKVKPAQLMVSGWKVE